MSLTSMTGFGRGEASARGIKAVIELGSTNRKQFECSLTAPRSLGPVEARLHALIQAAVRRGQVKGSIQVTVAPGAADASAGGIRIDLERGRAQIDALRRAGAELGLKDDLSASLLLTLPNVVADAGPSDDALALWPLVRQAAAQALARLTAMRAREGAALARDLRRRLKELRGLRQRIVRRAKHAPADYREALARRLTRLGGQPVDPAILARELVVFADRTDVSEELTRLGSHLDQAETLIRSGEPAGRPLDFLCQELLREINTVGSKANDAELAGLVVTFKSQLEAIREQVQNIE